MSFNFALLFAEGAVEQEELASCGFVADGEQLTFDEATFSGCEHLSIGTVEGWTVITDPQLEIPLSEDLDLVVRLSKGRRVLLATWAGVSDTYQFGVFRDGAEERWLSRSVEEDEVGGEPLDVEVPDTFLDEDSLAELVDRLTGAGLTGGDDLWWLTVTPLAPTA